MNSLSNEVLFGGRPDDVIWKSDVHVLSSKAKIYSRKDCDIVFLRKGSFMGSFDDRDEYYLIDKKSNGFLSKLFKKNKKSKNCDIYYINRVAELENLWGTPNRIDIYDKDYDIHSSVGANGTYKFSINNSMKLFSKVMGSNDSLTQDMVKKFFKSRLNMEIRNELATVFANNKFGMKDISTITTKEKVIARELKESLKGIFLDCGVTLNEFVISGFNYDEDFLNDIRDARKKSIIRKMEFDSGKDEREFARNSYQTVVDGVSKVQRASFNSRTESHTIGSDEEVKYCLECGTKLPKSAKFCSKCGYKFI